MKAELSVSRSELLSRMRMVGKIVQPSKNMESVSWFLMEAKQASGELVITGTDISGCMTARVECIVMDADVSVCVDAKQLINLVGEIPEQPITLKIGDNKMGVEYFGGVFEIPAFGTKEFPVLGDKDDAVSLPVKAQNLMNGIGKVADCVANDELRPAMSSVFVEKKDATLSFVGTNTHILTVVDTPYLGGDDVSAVIPVRAARLLSDMVSMCCTDKQEDVVLLISPKYVAVEIGAYRLFYRLSEGRYPNYRGVIPQNNDKHIVVDVKELRSVIKRISAVGAKEERVMRLRIERSVATLSYGSAKEGAFSKEELRVKSDVDEFEIGFNANMMLLLLQNIDTEGCDISFSSADRAMLLQPEGEDGLQMIQMPMFVERRKE